MYNDGIMFDKMFGYLEKTRATFYQWVASVFGISAIRIFIENFVSQRPDSFITTNLIALDHFFLFWIATVLMMIICVHFFTRKDIVSVSKVVLFGSVLIFLAPLLDLFITGGKGVQMAYLLVDSGRELLGNLFTFWQISPTPGVTTGMRIEIAVILLLILLYLRYSGLSWFRSLVSTFATYVLIFFILALPSFINVQTGYGWMVIVKNTLLGHNVLGSALRPASLLISYEMYFDAILSQVLYLLTVVFILVLGFLWNKKKTLSIIKNSRPERVLHYFTMLSLGIFLAYHVGFGPLLFGHWPDISSVMLLFVSFYFAWMYAVGVNDIVDSESDAVTNPNRPLVSEVITVEETKAVNLIFLLLALLGSSLVGPEALFMVIIFTFVYYIYSVPPLRLKRFAIINSFLVGIASLVAALAGFYTFSTNDVVEAFPKDWALLIFFTIALLSNIKDIKDIEGDKQFGIYTIPVIFGEKNGKMFVWIMVTASLCIICLTFHNYLFLVPSVISSAVAWFLIHRENFQERYLFVLYFVYLAALVLLSHV